MKKLTHKSAPAILDEQTLVAATGGNFEDDWCGTPWRRFPIPRPIFDLPVLEIPVIITRP